MAVVDPLVIDLGTKRGYRAFNQATDTLPGASGHPTPAPYDSGQSVVISDGFWLVCVDPIFSGGNTLTILGNGQLVIL